MRVLVQVCLVYAFGISGNAARQGHDLGRVLWVLEGFLLRGGETRRAAWLIAAAYSAGQSGEVFWEAFISFGFLG